ncbi:class I SAM-dependent methyltransferase [Pinirhizobacter sp.]|jgi:2-polyprenyl-3-methyl-5-hydroxy-6-metoxy-1,4-benzoquinol methylase|uniref:class I SAM-dependent methyltransferase n=1 Tax=Pinirhizobacter sp. TaxID=2950432 RepID=UPI002F3ED6D9
MSAQVKPVYDDIGSKFDEFTSSASQRPIEVRTYMGLLGDMAGLAVLDLACGHGDFSRRIHKLGARKVTGVDISPEMIRLARAQSLLDGDDILFEVGDARGMPELGQFDVVSAAWLFNYAEDPDQLTAMFRSVARNLKPGGRLVAYTVNPTFDLAKGNFTAYGVHVMDQTDLEGGARHRGHFMTDPPSPFTFHRWSAQAYATAAAAAGLSPPVWKLPCVEEADRLGRSGDYWTVFETNCLQAAFECRR